MRTFEGRPLPHPDEAVFDQGLAFDLGTLLSRRRALRMFGIGGGGLLLAACAPGASTPTAAPTAATGTTGTTGTTSATGTTGGVAAADCSTVIPQETAGPYPGDGSNGPDVLSQSGVVRSDIRSSFGELSGTADGVPLAIDLALLDVDNGCVPYAGAAVYLWQCDREGRYSLYSEGATEQNYLRGLQEADADGVVRFTSTFPACYSGRWPHLHFEVFPTLGEATDVANVIATSQVAIPADACSQVYGQAGYDGSVATFAQVSLETDNVFSDDAGASQLGTITGSYPDGFAIRLDVAVSPSTTPVPAGAPPGGPGGPPPGGG